MEAARILGFGCRIVSGYLYDPDITSVGSAGSGSTDAWAEIYVPVARDIRQVTPVSGSYGGAPATTEMTVRVRVSADVPPELTSSD
jgi:transglutaminase-like putative cysteine protease